MAAGVAGGGGGNASRTQAASRVLVPRGWQAGNLAGGNVIHAVLASGRQEWRRQGWAASAAGLGGSSGSNAAAQGASRAREPHVPHDSHHDKYVDNYKRNYMQSYVAAHPERMFMYRKREILRSARQHSRLPSKRSISRYSITAEELAGLIVGTQEAANRTGLSTHVWSIFPTPHGYARSSKPNEPVYSHTYFAPHVLEGVLRNRCGITIMALQGPHATASSCARGRGREGRVRRLLRQRAARPITRMFMDFAVQWGGRGSRSTHFGGPAWTESCSP